MTQLLYMSFSWQQLREWCASRLTRRLFAVLILVLTLWAVTNPALVSAYAGLGGYISEKMLGSAGNAGSLYLGPSTSGPVVLGSGPAIATTQINGADIALGPGTATLRGNLASLNGLTQASIYFVWGYSAGAMTNTTPVVTTAVLGDKSATIAFDTRQILYYQFIGGTDGTSRGGVLSIASGRAAAFHWLDDLLIIIIAAVIFILVIAKTGDPVAALLGAIIGLIAVYMVKSILGL